MCDRAVTMQAGSIEHELDRSALAAGGWEIQ
jgi:hypothetical protein